ncbi:PIN domain-containing protein [Gaiella occulta]|uniref:Ribonuclease VapC n=1 Tax=Gaiella occulta TaxID=1002870 RepID=A0A7M2YZJ6_9ACTN|nr:type II toxin-antitoxin system VapC family toxin [Gaiella occulta]RDI75510.1 PIN domain-containing protein [Gaiella occulta]
MRLSDVNLLLYAVDSSSPRHAAAREWLEGQLSGVETFAFPVSVLLAFVRLATQSRIFSSPFTPGEAFDVVQGWLAQPCATTIAPGERHLLLVRELLEPHGTAGNLVSDAHLAALAIEHGAELCSADNDFARFPRLRWSNPLASRL